MGRIINNDYKFASKQEKEDRYFSKEDTQRAQTHMKRCSASLAIRVMQINTTVRYHFPPLRMAIINKSRNNKFW